MSDITPYRIPITSIRLAPQLNCRPIDKSHIESLMFQIRSGAILPPILVRPQNGYYEIVQGQHRFEAYRLLGYSEVISYIKVMSDQEVYLQSISENVVRNNLKDVDMWRNAFKLYQQGFTVKDIAQRLQLTESKVRQNIKFEYFLADEIKIRHSTKKIPFILLEQLCRVGKLHQVLLCDTLSPYKSESYSAVFDNFVATHHLNVLNSNITSIPKINLAPVVNVTPIQPYVTPIQPHVTPIQPHVTPLSISIGGDTVILDSLQIKKLREVISGNIELKSLTLLLDSKFKLS